MEEKVAWVIFWATFGGLAAFDLLCLAPRLGGNAVEEQVSNRKAFVHCLFWFCVGLAFNGGVWAGIGSDAALVWFNGYILEYLLSTDNLFFFHVVFTAYATPPQQIYKGLFLGILGAVVLRFLFYFVGAKFFRLAYAVQVLFALALIYSGYTTAVSNDDEETDPRSSPAVRFITRFLPFTESYDENGALFARVVLEEHAKPQAEVLGRVIDSMGPAAAANPKEEEPEAGIGVIGDGGTGGAPEGGVRRTALRGTLLLLVALVLQVVDLLFAVDSVTAKIAERDSIFLNFSSSAFAMLCLRSLYFMLTKLLKYFRFLKYGVSGVLVMIGIKLIVSPWLKVSTLVSMLTICGAFAFSVCLSAIIPEKEAYSEMEEEGAAERRPGPIEERADNNDKLDEGL